MRRRLDRSPHPCAPARNRSLRRRDVQHVDCARRSRARCAPAARSTCSAAISSRQTGCEEGSPGTRRGLRSFRRGLVLGVERGTAADLPAGSPRRPSSSATSSEPVDEPMNTLMPGAAGQPLQLGQSRRVVVRAADVEGEIAMHAAVGAARSCRPASRASSSADWCWASRTRRSRRPSRPRAIRSRGLPCASSPGSRKCTWVSMTPGRNMQARCSRSPCPPKPRQVINGHGPARKRVSAVAPRLVVDHDAALEDQIVRIGHAGTASKARAPPTALSEFRREFWKRL